VTVLRLFFVEHRLPRITDAELALLEAALNDTCRRLTARGEAVRYLGSAYLPGPERLLSLFEAATADAVRTVSESSQAPASDLEAAIVLPPPLLSAHEAPNLHRARPSACRTWLTKVRPA
jgi:hypothetical protein